MIGTYSGNVVEFGVFSHSFGKAVGAFLLANISADARDAIKRKIITPKTNEMLRLAGIEVDGQPPLTLDELVGPTLLRDLPRGAQAIYCSGPNHPLLVKARRSPVYVTYTDLLGVHADLGIRKEDVTVNFKGLARSAFNDASIITHGSPHERWDFEGYDVNNIHQLRRFAIHRDLARRAMIGDYSVGISGTDETDIFNGYGRSLLRALFEQQGQTARLDLEMHLESLDKLAVPETDPDFFHWKETYHDAEGMGYSLFQHDYRERIYRYTEGLLEEVGISRDRWQDPWVGMTNEAFVLSIRALCPLDTAHKRNLKNGHSCNQGVHSKGLTAKAVQRAKTIAEIIAKGEDRDDTADDEINLDDPDLFTSGSRRAAPVAADHEW